MIENSGRLFRSVVKRVDPNTYGQAKLSESYIKSIDDDDLIIIEHLVNN